MKITKMKKSIILTIFVLLLTACGTVDQDPNNSSKVSDHDIHLANNQLGFELLKTIEPDESGNTFISPTSLFMALSMVYNGAEGETKQEIAKTLQMEGIELEELNQAND